MIGLHASVDVEEGMKNEMILCSRNRSSRAMRLERMLGRFHRPTTGVLPGTLDGLRLVADLDSEFLCIEALATELCGFLALLHHGSEHLQVPINRCRTSELISRLCPFARL
jgi:hypothetical protein